MSDLVLGIRLTADGKDLVGAVKVSAAEIDKMTGATKRAATESEKLNSQQKSLGESLNSVASRIGAYTIGWNVAVDAIKSAAGAIKDYIKEAALLNARHETMGVVLEVVGRNAGYSRREMDMYSEAVRRNGITMIASRENVVKMVQANLDLSIASKLARAAQDAAVIANINSSEAFTRLIYAIQSGQPEMLRTMGINVSFEAAYKKMAAQLKVTTEQLTEQEKTQARANATLQGTIQIAGTYEAAMGTAGKMLNSLARYTEDLKVMRGEVFNDALVIAVNAYTDSLKDADTETRRLADSKKLQEWGRDLVTVFAWVGDIVVGAFHAISSAVELAGLSVMKVAQTLSKISLPTRLLFNAAGGDDYVDSLGNVVSENIAARLGRKQFRASAAEYYAGRDSDATERALQQREGDRELALARSLGLKTGPKPEARPAGKTGAGSDPYPAMVKSLKEMLLIESERTEVNKLQLSLDAMSAKQLAQITPARKAELENLAAQVDAKKQALAVDKAALEYATAQAALQDKNDETLANFNTTMGEHLDQLRFETELYGQSKEQKQIAIELRKLDAEYTKAQVGLNEDQLATLTAIYDLQRERLPAAVAANNAARVQADKSKQLAKDLKRGQVDAWQSIDRTAHDTFISIFDSGKSAFDRLRDTLKNGLYELLYQMTLKKWIINISGAASGAGVASSAFGASGGGLNLLSSASNLAGAAGIFGSAGAYAAAVPGLTSAAAGSQAALLAAQTGAFGAEGLALTSAAGGSTLGGGISAAMAAIPGWGWAALGAAAIGAYMLSDEGDAQRTGNWSASLGQVGGSTQNKWFDSSTGAGSFAAELAASERQISELLKLNTTQIDIIDTKLAALAGQQYGFGMEHTDWMESGAAQAIAADRLRAIADSLGLSVESLAAKMADAQKQIDIAPQKLQLEIDLMKLQGKTAEALAAERKRELAALDPLLRGLQEQIYAEQDLAAAANDATGAVSTLAQQIDDVRTAAADAVDAQIDASRNASQAARQAADSYRALTASLGDAVRELRGGDLSPLMPAQKLAEAGSALDSLFGKVMTGDAAAFAAFPQAATDFLTALRAQEASSEKYTAGFDRVMGMFEQAQAAGMAMTNWEEYQATLLETQTGLLGQIRAELQKPNPDLAVLNQQASLLATIAGLLQEQTVQVVAGNTFVHDQTGRIIAVNDTQRDQTGKIVAGNALITGQIITGNATQDVIKNISSLNTSYSEEMLKALVIGGTTQADSLQGIFGASDLTVSLLRQLVSLTEQKTAQDQADAAAAAVAEQQAAAERVLQQQISQATAAFEAEKSVVGALRSVRDTAVANLGVSQAPAAFTQENLTTGTASGYEYFTYFVGQEALVAAAKAANSAYVAGVAKAYDLYNAIPGHAAGGVASGWSMVGELGPELVNFSAPGRVYTADQTSAALGAGAGKEDVARLEKLMEETNAILARLVAAQSSGTATIATAVEDSAQSIGRTVARAAEAGARA